MAKHVSGFCARVRLAKTVSQIKYFKQPAGISKPDAIDHEGLMLRPSACYHTYTQTRTRTRVHSA